jgi:hypothetical protein
MRLGDLLELCGDEDEANVLRTRAARLIGSDTALQ